MDGTVNPAAIAISISIGISLMAGLAGGSVAMRQRQGAAVKRDTVVQVLFGIALSLIGLYLVAIDLVVVWGIAYLELAKAVLLLTAAFAILGIMFGLVRGLRSGKAIDTLTT